jgi:spheroidene monooxygenase
MDSPPTATTAFTGVVAVLLVDYLRQHQAWGWKRLARGPAAFRDVPGMLFSKVMGSGHDGGFSLRPSTSHQGLVCMLRTAADARAFLAGPHVLEARTRARESWTGLLAVTSSRGAWDGQTWGASSSESLGAHAHDAALSDAPVAALTRASIRPTKVAAFWRHAPASQEAMAQARGCDLAVGLGEAPVLRQCTFSLWRDLPAMTAYARGGAHGAAAQAAIRQDYFTESMFVRMKLLESDGDWKTLHAPAAAPAERAHG